jgi:hypothetical protein
MTNARRVFVYLVSLVGLILLSWGLGTLLGLVFTLITRGAGVTPDNVSSQQFSLSLAMLIIGGGLWLPFWRSIQRRVAASPAEIGAGFRKLYLNFIQTVAALTALFAAVDSLNWLLAGPVAADFPSIRLATLIVTALVWYYHWRLSESEGQPTPAARTLRRWYIYILSAVGLITFAFNLVEFISTRCRYCLMQPIYSYGDVAGLHDNLSAASTAAGWSFLVPRLSRRRRFHPAEVYFYLLLSPQRHCRAVALANTLYYIRF